MRIYQTLLFCSS